MTIILFQSIGNNCLFFKTKIILYIVLVMLTSQGLVTLDHSFLINKKTESPFFENSQKKEKNNDKKKEESKEKKRNKN